MIDPQRESSYRLYWNESPESMLEWDASHSFSFVDWTTYSFAGRKFYDPITGNKLKDDVIIGRFIQFQHKMSNMANSPLYPVIWVSSPPKSLHFHCLEFHCGITRKQRAKAFQNRFGTLTKLPKNLYNSVIQATRTTDYRSCFYYGDKGHNQLITELITPKKHDGIPLELMGKLNPAIKGHQRMLDKHYPEALSFEKQLLALLSD